MNPNCIICKSVHDNEVKVVYEDEKIVAFLAQRPASVGHVIITSREHYAIIEQVPDFIISHMFNIANKISAALFDSLSIQGTNILVQNGIEAGQQHPHFSVHVIPRIEGDKLELQWKTLSPSQEELATVELQLKDHVKNIGEFEKEKPPPINIDSKKETYSYDDEEENYLMRQLRRLP